MTVNTPIYSKTMTEGHSSVRLPCQPLLRIASFMTEKFQGDLSDVNGFGCGVPSGVMEFSSYPYAVRLAVGQAARSARCKR